MLGDGGGDIESTDWQCLMMCLRHIQAELCQILFDSQINQNQSKSITKRDGTGRDKFYCSH